MSNYVIHITYFWARIKYRFGGAEQGTPYPRTLRQSVMGSSPQQSGSLSNLGLIQSTARGETMQNGSIMQAPRLRGPNVWEYRWREPGSDGKLKHRRMVIGSLDQF